jgi:hypothetical protein
MMFVPMERRNVLTMMDRLLPIGRADHRPFAVRPQPRSRAPTWVTMNIVMSPASNIVAPSCARPHRSSLLKARIAGRVPPISDRGFQMRISETRICLLRVVRHEQHFSDLKFSSTSHEVENNNFAEIALHKSSPRCSNQRASTRPLFLLVVSCQTVMEV